MIQGRTVAPAAPTFARPVMGQGSFQRRVTGRVLREQAEQLRLLQGSLAVERRAHNSEAAGSIPAPAPISRP